MKKQDYQCSFTAPVSPDEALEQINDVQAWWAKQFEGSSHALHDVFIVRFGGPKDTFVRFEITELIPGKKVIWYVTDCYLHWIKDKTEWTGTEIRWEVEPNGDGATIRMTHHGLTPEMECFTDCQAGWDHHIKDSLYKYMAEQVGTPE
ncbi:MAG TPA: SRPBCC domain-containing protein [Puia sp.]